MASIYHYLSETEGVCKKPTFTKNKVVATTEIWKNNASPPATDFEYLEISKPDLQRWLNQTNGSCARVQANNTRNTVLRIIWMPLDTQHGGIDMDEDLFNQISTAFQHQSAYAFLKTQYSGIGSMRDQNTSPEVWFLCNHPKLSVTWSRDVNVGVTSMICVADRDRLKRLQGMTEKKFLRNLAEHEMTPALMSALMSSEITDIRNKGVKGQVEEVEHRTGHHDRRSFPPDDLSNQPRALVELSAMMGGCVGRTQASIRRVGVTTEFLTFISNHLEGESNIKLKNEMLAVNRVIEQRSVMQELDLKYTLSRIQTQKDALFNLISAKSSQTASSIAEKSRQIALFTRSDSQNMKFLAYLTMFYLPATFLSSLFSTPIFQRESSSDSPDATVVEVWVPGLKLYIPLALALMMMTALACVVGYFWPRLKERYSSRRKRGSDEAQQQTEGCVC